MKLEQIKPDYANWTFSCLVTKKHVEEIGIQCSHPKLVGFLINCADDTINGFYSCTRDILDNDMVRFSANVLLPLDYYKDGGFTHKFGYFENGEFTEMLSAPYFHYEQGSIFMNDPAQLAQL